MSIDVNIDVNNYVVWYVDEDGKYFEYDLDEWDEDEIDYEEEYWNYFGEAEYHQRLIQGQCKENIKDRDSRDLVLASGQIQKEDDF